MILSNTPEALDLIGNTYRPKVNKKTGQALHVNAAGEIVGNSRLEAREWTLLDREIMDAARIRMEGVSDLRSAGLVNGGIDYGVMEIQRRVQSETGPAALSMDIPPRSNNDRTDRKRIGVPLPVIHKGYQFGERELRSNRMAGIPLDTIEAREAAQSVAETLEGILFNGTSEITLNGVAVKGYLNATGALSATAASLGGAAWSLAAENPYNTIKGVLAAMEDRRRHGPFMLYVNSTNYFQMLSLRTSTDTRSIDLVKSLPMVSDVKISPLVAAGTLLVVQMTKDVVELQEAMPVENREWENGNRSTFFGQVMTIAIPFVQYDYNNQTGIAIVSGI